MNTLIQFKTTTPWRHGFLLIPLVLVCFALAPAVQAADGGVGNGGTAEGTNALQNLTTGGWDTAVGNAALFTNTTGGANTAIGYQALFKSNGQSNTATGARALLLNTSGHGNTAVGVNALFNNTTGSNNVVLGVNGGSSLTTGSNNIDIGSSGIAGESNTIRIGKRGTQVHTFIAGVFGEGITLGTPVIIDFNGNMGTLVSSQRFKREIKPMDKASEAILALRPVTFHYKKELDPKGIPQFGLVAEEVEKVNPDLVVPDAQGKPYSVRYEAVNAMLLNEFLKEHRKVEDQEATITQLKSTVAQQQKGMEVLAASLKEQASQIQKVSARLEMSKPVPQIVLNNQ